MLVALVRYFLISASIVAASWGLIQHFTHNTYMGKVEKCSVVETGSGHMYDQRTYYRVSLALSIKVKGNQRTVHLSETLDAKFDCSLGSGKFNALEVKVSELNGSTAHLSGSKTWIDSFVCASLLLMIAWLLSGRARPTE
jgi:hypothetical protein